MNQAKYKDGDVIITRRKWKGQIQSPPKYRKNGKIEYHVWIWGADAYRWIDERNIVGLEDDLEE